MEKEEHARRMWRLVVEALEAPKPASIIAASGQLQEGKATSSLDLREHVDSIPNYRLMRRRSSLPDIKITQISVNLNKQQTEKRTPAKREYTKKYKSKRKHRGDEICQKSKHILLTLKS